jgi:hypothetical protein
MTLCEGVESEAVLSLRHAERVLEAMHSQVGVPGVRTVPFTTVLICVKILEIVPTPAVFILRIDTITGLQL